MFITNALHPQRIFFYTRLKAIKTIHSGFANIDIAGFKILKIRAHKMSIFNFGQKVNYIRMKALPNINFITFNVLLCVQEVVTHFM